MNAPRHDFHIGPEPLWRQPRERSGGRTLQTWLMTIAGIAFAYAVFVFIAKGGW